jgi:YegS/Rv2252/BmrU family lipid kinase
MNADKNNKSKRRMPLVVVNPQSAGGATGAAWPGIASDLRTHFGPFEVAFSEYAGHSAVLAEGAAADGRLIIACGGDGTVNEVANGIIKSGAAAELGLLPSGTGGDFRRTLGLSTHPATAARALRESAARRMDAGRVTYTNGAGKQETRYFLGVASFGMSADVIKRVKDKDSSWLSAAGALLGGRGAFAVAALQSTLAAEHPQVRVRLDGQDEGQMTVANLCVANARYFGGGMKIAPDAKLDDGLFDVVVIGDLSAAEILANAHKLYRGSHLSLDRVGHARARSVSARPAENAARVALEIDGELLGAYLPATFEVVPSALLVRA